MAPQMASSMESTARRPDTPRAMAQDVFDRHHELVSSADLPTFRPELECGVCSTAAPGFVGSSLGQNSVTDGAGLFARRQILDEPLKFAADLGRTATRRGQPRFLADEPPDNQGKPRKVM